MSTKFTTTPEEALVALASHNGPVLIDLDETLFFLNSTEEFINCAMPGLMALLLMRLLDVLKPWRWTGGEVTRDVWRVRCIVCFFPWTLLVWKHRLASLSKKYVNEPLVASLASTKQEVTIVTVGFKLIVFPLIKQFGLRNVDIVSCRLGAIADRRRGKLALATEQLGIEQVRQSLIITDSVDDLPILEVCAKPFLVIWPQAAYRTALTRVYLPGQYVSQIKRPGERYILRGIIQEDFAFWVLASLALAPNPLMHVIGLSFMLLSFWAIYERGYVDNDYVAAHFETAPKLAANYWTSVVATPVWQPWVWGFGSGVIAVAILNGPTELGAIAFIKWSAALIGTYGWFKRYNRYDKLTRTWMFGPLQLMRSAAFLILVPCEVIGVAAVAAHAFARWVPYFMYRFGNKAWPTENTQTIRLLFFLALATLSAVSLGISTILNWTGLALLLWNIFRARKELPILFKSAHRIDIAPQLSPQDSNKEEASS
jgi:hypothetical protein